MITKETIREQQSDLANIGILRENHRQGRQGKGMEAVSLEKIQYR